MEITNLTRRAMTLASPAVRGQAGYPVSRWYVVGSDGKPWDGVLAGGETKSVNVIGYLRDAVRPGTRLDAEVAISSLVVPVTTKARRRWDVAE
jgi:hypothetical protein